MGFYDRYILPYLINCACGTKPIHRQRQKVVPLARGTVLEIGIGTGLNLRHYDSRRVDKVIGLDPSEKSWEIARRRNPDVPFELDFIGLPGEEIPLDDSSFDTIVMTYSLCTIPDPQTALRGMRRVLREEGTLIFCEHGKAPDAQVQKWQDRINPYWKAIAGGCHLNRHIPELLETAGFQVDAIDSMYLPGTPRFAGYNFWGTAR